MTVDFSHGYLPPDVYISEEPTTLVSVTGVPPSILAICGPSVGYRTYTEQVILGASSTLSKQGVDLATVSVTLVADGSTVDPDDYTAAAAGSTSTQDYYSTITRDSGATTPVDTAVFVTYRYVPPDFFSPTLYSDFEDVKDALGQPVNFDPQVPGDTTYQPIVSPISLAASIAFSNGAPEILLVATTPPGGGATTDAQKSTSWRNALKAAYGKIATDYNVNVVVGLTDGIVTGDATGTAQELRQHVEEVSNDGYMRTGVIGFPTGVATAPDTLISSGSLQSKRLLFAYATPSGMAYFAGGSNAVYALGHQYLAAAYGGLLVTGEPQDSITKRIVRGFSGLYGVPLSNTLKNQYAQGGVALTEVDRLGNLVVRHGVTTDPTNVNTREVSVVRARDTLVTVLQNGLQNSGMIGTPIDEDTPINVKSVVSGLLDFLAGLGTIVSYEGPQVRVASLDPSVVEVKFTYKPAYPLNYILVSFSLDMTTGDTSLAA